MSATCNINAFMVFIALNEDHFKHLFVLQCDGGALASVEYLHSCHLVHPLHGNDCHFGHVTKLLDCSVRRKTSKKNVCWYIFMMVIYYNVVKSDNSYFVLHEFQNIHFNVNF